MGGLPRNNVVRVTDRAPNDLKCVPGFPASKSVRVYNVKCWLCVIDPPQNLIDSLNCPLETMQ